MAGASEPWNHNTHFHARLLRLLPPRLDRSLDVGCGDGRFAVALAARSTEVVALDNDGVEVARCRERCQTLSNVVVRHADFLSADLPDAHFDAVTALAALHHLDFEAATAEVRRVLRPGGTFVLLGVWTDKGRRDLVWNMASAYLNRSLQRRRGPDEMSSPAILPTTPLSHVTQDFRRALPGAQVRRHLLWRYTVRWQKPL